MYRVSESNLVFKEFYLCNKFKIADAISWFVFSLMGYLTLSSDLILYFRNPKNRHNTYINIYVYESISNQMYQFMHNNFQYRYIKVSNIFNTANTHTYIWGDCDKNDCQKNMGINLNWFFCTAEYIQKGKW